jgi:serine-type D-Ala-D-Ala carboxypeptidase/endopeptidase (penicillin-binding protein 4)
VKESSTAGRTTRRQILSLSAALTLSLAPRSGRAQAAAGQVGQTPARPAAPAALAPAVIADLERWAQARGIELGASLVELSSGREIAGSAAQKALNPASSQKILTIAAALDRLGPGFRFTSSLHGLQSGDSVDQLVLRSDGNPELSSSDLLFLVARLVAFGVRRVRGDVLVDQSAFDADWEPPAYEQRPDDWAAYRAPVSAVAVDGNAVTLNVRATAEAARALVWLEPAGVGRVDGSIVTLPAGHRENVGLTIVPNTSPVLARVSGGIPSSRGGLSYARRLPAPALAPAHVLCALLERAGITVAGRAALGGSGVAAELARVESRPLAQIVHALGKRSDNFTAEMLLKALGRPAKSAPGTSSAGASAIEGYLRARAAWTPGTRVLNGSGLYDANRVSAFTLTRVLQLAHSDPRIGPELTASLAVGGVDGTLLKRFTNESATRRVRAKTGTLSSVITLAGYLYAPTPLAFAFLLNGMKGGQSEARQRIDGALTTLLAGRY